jgi:hypothetical protein
LRLIFTADGIEDDEEIRDDESRYRAGYDGYCNTASCFSKTGSTSLRPDEV